jgi:4-hydroxy-3-polyprenylbenzoate decarboxylase
VVDDDIDIYDIEDVMWAVCTRSYPEEMDLLKKTWSSTSDPTRRPGGTPTTSRAIIYAVKPWEWKSQFPKTNMVPVETRKKMFDKYKGLFDGRWTQL